MPSNASSVMKDIGAYVHPASGGVQSAVETEVDGDWVAVPDDAQSAAVLIKWSAVLADTETLSIAGNVQDATDGVGAGAADFKAIAAEGADLVKGKFALADAVQVTSVGGTTETGVTMIYLPDIRSHRGFLRSQHTATNSGAGAILHGVTWIFGGTRTIPTERPTFLTNSV